MVNPKSNTSGHQRRATDNSGLVRKFDEFQLRRASLAGLIASLRDLDEHASISAEENRRLAVGLETMHNELVELARGIVASMDNSPTGLRAKALVVQEFAQQGADDIVHIAALALARAVLAHTSGEGCSAA